VKETVETDITGHNCCGEDDGTMKPKRTKNTISPPLAEIPGADRDLLAHAYKAGLIVSWRQDHERGYRLTLGDRRDEYVEITKLSSYLEGLSKGAS